ncbi:MAG TPA: hypothetical protein VI703_01890 [Anaerolineales bacterium]|jgi:hypothetical protein|nr:hypothetical protein [Anaerolineales bacterium]
MTTEAASDEKGWRTRVIYKRNASEAVYGLGLLGAWFYYITTATTFWMGALGIIKGIFWPAFLIYELMRSLGM